MGRATPRTASSWTAFRAPSRRLKSSPRSWAANPPPIDAVIVLDAPTEALVKRLSGRRICESCQDSYHLAIRPPKVAGVCDRCGGALIQRADDGEETVRFRQGEYKAKTQPVLDYFREHGWPLREVDALGDIDQIFGRIYATIFWPA